LRTGCRDKTKCDKASGEQKECDTSQALHDASLMTSDVFFQYKRHNGYALIFSRYINNTVANIVSRTSGVLLLLVALYSVYANGSKLFF
jgi:hypothetical protein